MPVLRLPEHILFKVPHRPVKSPTHLPTHLAASPEATKRRPSFSLPAQVGLTEVTASIQ